MPRSKNPVCRDRVPPHILALGAIERDAEKAAELRKMIDAQAIQAEPIERIRDVTS